MIAVSQLPFLSFQFPVNRDLSRQWWTATRRQPWWDGSQVMELCRTWSRPQQCQATTSPVRPRSPTASWRGCSVARVTLSLSKLWEKPAAASLTCQASWSQVSSDTSNTVYSFRFMPCWMKCFSILEVLPPLQEISSQQLFHFPGSLSFFVTFESLQRSAMVQNVNCIVSSSHINCWCTVWWRLVRSTWQVLTDTVCTDVRDCKMFFAVHWGARLKYAVRNQLVIEAPP